MKLEFVRLNGLKGAAHLNGKKGFRELDTMKNGRYCVHLSDRKVAVKLENIEVTEFKPNKEATLSVDDVNRLIAALEAAKKQK